MRKIHSMGHTVKKTLAGALAIGAIGVLSSSSAEAHFILKAPASWMSQDTSGSPQKMFPCGDEGGGTATGTVTAYQPGQTITVTIDETVFHTGHYRIALAVNNRSELPAEPVATPAATCGSVKIQSPPVFPVLADGVFAHTAAFTAPQSVQITLPSNITCTNCTLQIMEFMQGHAAPCFYHHCANISIGAPPTDAGGGGQDASVDVDASAGSDASAGGSDAGGTHPDSSTGSGGSGATGAAGGCAISGQPTSAIAGLAGLVALAALASRRRQRR